MGINSSFIIYICWWVINTLLVFTAFLKSYTFLSNIAIGMIVFISYKSFNIKQKKFMTIYGLVLSLLGSISMVWQNEGDNIIRFVLILFFLGVSYFIKIPVRHLLIPLKITSLVLSIILIIGEIYFKFISEPMIITSIRHLLLEKGIGDLYSKYGLFYAIQIVGTASLPFIYMLSFVEDDLYVKWKSLSRLIVLSGIIIAGNLGFLFALTFFLYVITGIILGQ